MGERVFDCIIIGAGPGGLQAAIYLGRYNRDVLLLDRGGGRTWHARHIENLLTHREITGAEIIERSVEQAAGFGVHIERQRVETVKKERVFTVATREAEYAARFVLASSGVTDILPPIGNLLPFLGSGYYTCMDCDGHKTTGKRLIVTGDRLQSMKLALAMQRMYTRDITYLPLGFSLPEAAAEVLDEAGVKVVTGEPRNIIGRDAPEALELADGRHVPCEAIMASFGVKLNDAYMAGLGLKRDAERFKYAVNGVYESSLAGLYIVGPLNTGQDQVVIAAGEGAVAAIDINKRLLEEKDGVA